jgi:diaminohydroxyphosphoribosylaminopyrimidine deaminase/5-amino-6-(5-phosphoribosylamino)uracil reductase
MTEQSTSLEETLMRRAIALAKRAWGRTHPNPHVGALIVENGAVVAEGWHERAGEPHAEINALRNLGRRPAPDATLYVTLEPCCTHGRTGACTDAILAAGIKRVIAGATDPSPAHSGRGFELLRAAGVEVITGVLADECADLNLIFNHRVSQSHGSPPAPFIALKTATTLDGRIASRSGNSQWITGDAARADVARWRRYFPAIATSAATVLADNPRLTARIAGEPEWCPRRFVLDRSGRLLRHLVEAAGTVQPTGLHIFDDPFADAQTVLVTAAGEEAAGEFCAARSPAVSAVWRLPRENFLAAFHRRCAAESIAALFLEGGGSFLGAWLDSGLADYLFYYTAPKILADADARPAFAGSAPRPRLADALALQNVRRELFGDDLLTRGFLHKKDS